MVPIASTKSSIYCLCLSSRNKIECLQQNVFFLVYAAMTHPLILKSSSIWSRLVIFGCISWEHIICTICAHYPDISYKNHTMIWRSSYHHMILISISWCFLPWQPNNFLKAYQLGNQGSSPWRWSSWQCDDDHIIRSTGIECWGCLT